jgi:hypothetical protein
VTVLLLDNDEVVLAAGHSSEPLDTDQLLSDFTELPVHIGARLLQLFQDKRPGPVVFADIERLAQEANN